VEEGYDPVKARSKGKGAKKVPDLFGKPGVDITTTKVSGRGWVMSVCER